jgi:DivIVA domain-containing protein
MYRRHAQREVLGPISPTPRRVLGAADVASKEFLVVSRGFDQEEVRAFLARVAVALQERDGDLRHLVRECGELAARLARAETDLEQTRRQLRDVERQVVVADAVRQDALARAAAAERARIELEFELRQHRLSNGGGDQKGATQPLAEIVRLAEHG